MFLVFSPGSLRERSLQNRKFPISEQHIKSRNKKYRKDNNNNNNNETTGKTKRNYACAILLPIGWKLPAQMVRKRGRKATIFQNHFQFRKVHFSMIICFTALRVPETAYFALLFTMFNNSFFSDWLEKDELMLMRKETGRLELAYHFAQRRRISLPKFLPLRPSRTREQKQTEVFNKFTFLVSTTSSVLPLIWSCL